MPDYATVLAPLNALLRKDSKWRWTRKEENAFKDAKTLLLNSQTLIHYDDSLPLYLACDASSYGCGCVESHRVHGEDRAIAFASCSLSDTQKKYSQMDKEALAIIFGVKRFHQYLYGRRFTIVTDHEPLTKLFKPENAVPVHSAARLQRWSLILVGYCYDIEYRNMKQHANADSMSRLPLPQIWQPKSSFIKCFFFEEEVVTNITSERI